MALTLPHMSHPLNVPARTCIIQDSHNQQHVPVCVHPRVNSLASTEINTVAERRLGAGTFAKHRPQVTDT